MTWMLQGAHRGGATIAGLLPASTARTLGDELVVADPAPGRAGDLASQIALRLPGTRARGIESPGATLVHEVPDDATLVLASDTAASVLDTLRARDVDQATLWQLCGRGPGGAAGRRFALHGTAVAGDELSVRESTVLLEAFDRIAPPQSSRAMTGADSLTAATLAPLRAAVSNVTVSRTTMLDRDPADIPFGPFVLFGGTVPYPLVVRRETDNRFRSVRESAISALDDVPPSRTADRGALGRFVVVAVVVVAAPAVHLVTVATSRADRRRIEGLATIDVPPMLAPIARATPALPAALTD